MNPAKLLLNTLLFVQFSQISTSIDTISLSQPIRDGDVIVSSRKFYALGFFSPGNSVKRYVGIWYNQISEQTLVWVANRDNPINGTFGVLSVNIKGNLVLYESNQSTVPVWQANISDASTGNSVAQLLDSGNLVLVRNDTGETLWQSFDHPTDTLLPNMRLGWDKRTGFNRYLTAWKSPDDPGSGNCSFKMDLAGFSQVSLYKSDVKWWRAGSWTGQRLSGVPEMTRNFIFNITYMDNQDEVFVYYSLNNPSILSRMVVNETGFEQRFTWSSQDRRWIGFWTAPKEQCDYYGHCGPNSNCSPYHADEFECTCLPGFEPKYPKEWSLRDGSGGCKRKLGTSTCQKGEGFIKLTLVKVPDTSVAAHVDMNLGLKACEEKCLGNCSCVAYASAYAETNGGIGCLIYHGDLNDTRTYTNAGQDLFVRADAAELARKRRLALIIVAIVLGVLLLGLCYFFLWRRLDTRIGERQRQRRRELLFLNSSTRLSDREASTSAKRNKDTGNVDVTFFELSTVLAATDNFSTSNKLGQGGFGPVYKGKLANGQEIAVKRLSTTSGQGIEEFKNEVLLIAKLQHRNLVKLLGCCLEKDEKMLIYEFMPNKSLDYFIFDESRKQLLDWKKRFDIILGIARGVLYLHQDSRLRIIHRDLKASNILLDEEMNPRISDFGTARVFGGEEISTNTNRVVGTYGYMSPEYALGGLFSTKSDVFSFGVLLLEIITGKKNTGIFNDDSSNLIRYVWELWSDDKALEIVDSSMADSCPAPEALRCIQVGLLCVQDRTTDRPSMSTVVFMLSNETSVPSPKQPTFSVRKIEIDTDYSSTGTKSSANEVTLTTFIGR
ncbi:Receptor-like serine/threonine-protein kinase SD1-8 [Citrus sinensis]|uniref:Receptor-like serine/threonine-protein kinase SD1-8 n=1 Tax=Citrus sinensis TaxID=2711 RepID=A0ACB8NGC2_CITSI|nr:Receptor-like serine/threonine-protein kinase SD1-8 [Citrus sinensis]